MDNAQELYCLFVAASSVEIRSAPSSTLSHRLLEVAVLA